MNFQSALQGTKTAREAASLQSNDVSINKKATDIKEAHKMAAGEDKRASKDENP